METEAKEVDARSWSPLPQDLVLCCLALLFALLSFSHPGGASLEGGGTEGPAFLGVALLSLLMPFLPRRAPALLRFVRTFYPQLFLALFFSEAIRLSSLLFGGRSHDLLVASWDRALFGFQPARRFHEAFAGSPFLDELMFGSYFLFYILFAVTPWIPWLRGRREEAERQIFVYVGMMALIFCFYLVFRVEGPKYWFPDLRAQAYGEFTGALFVPFFQNAFRHLRLDGAAFPSSHVAFASLALVFAGRSSRRLLWAYVPAFLLIASATVYIYAHYVADALGGILAAALLGPPLWRLYPFLRRRLGGSA